jgi:outer membrane protein assembly factor BamE (lipoprotein component of BamABCDE complex)
MKKIIIAAILSGILCGCVTTASRMDGLNVGMTKKEVIHIMGKPSSVAAQGNGVEFFRYELPSTVAQVEYHITQEYYVKFEDGLVDSYGRMGDFNSTKNPTVNENINANVNTH